MSPPDASRRARLARNVRVVLVRPRVPGNVGAAARALENMGLRDLVVVASPWIPSREELLASSEARALAASSAGVLEAARVVADLGSALEGVALAVAFTARPRRRPRPRLALLEHLLPRIRSTARCAPVALVFGPEDGGLDNEDLQSCQLFARLSSDRSSPVLNLAASVLLACYELRRPAEHREAPSPDLPASRTRLEGGPGHPTEAADPPEHAPADASAGDAADASADAAASPERPGAHGRLATVEERHRLDERFAELMALCGLRGGTLAHRVDAWSGLLARADLEAREQRFLMGTLALLRQRLQPPRT